jgi:hypothetical protein
MDPQWFQCGSGPWFQLFLSQCGYGFESREPYRTPREYIGYRFLSFSFSSVVDPDPR